MLGEQIKQSPGRRRPLRIVHPDVRMGHGAVANDLEHPPAGQYIEADDGNSRRSKMLLADPHQGFAHRLGNPAVDAVTNDEVELPVGSAKLSEAPRLNIDIGEAQAVYPSPA